MLETLVSGPANIALISDPITNAKEARVYLEQCALVTAEMLANDLLQISPENKFPGRFISLIRAVGIFNSK